MQEEKELPAFIVGVRSPISQLETNTTGDSMETQELEDFPTPIETSLSPTVEVNHNENGDHPVSQAQLLKKEKLSCPTSKKCFRRPGNRRIITG